MLVNFSKKNQLKLSILQWIITFSMFVYSTFVLAVIVAFIEEDAIKAALLMGIVFGFIAVIWPVLIARFIFIRKLKLKKM